MKNAANLRSIKIKVIACILVISVVLSIALPLIKWKEITNKMMFFQKIAIFSVYCRNQLKWLNQDLKNTKNRSIILKKSSKDTSLRINN